MILGKLVERANFTEQRRHDPYIIDFTVYIYSSNYDMNNNVRVMGRASGKSNSL